MSIFNPALQLQYWTGKREAFEAIKNIPLIPELTANIPHHSFKVISKQEALEEIIGNNQIIVVAGGEFGDEAKGKWGNVFAEIADIVLRANSGANTGRTAYHKDTGKKFVFHGVPAALLEGKISLIGPETVNDPISLLDEEIIPLMEAGIDCSPLKIGNFYITTPYHRIMDVLGSPDNSSTGVGITPTYKSVKGKTCPRLDDLFQTKEHLQAILRRDLRNYVGFLASSEGQEGREGLNPVTVVEKLQTVQLKNKRVVPSHVLEFAEVYALEGKEKAIEYLIDRYHHRITEEEKFPKRVNVPSEIRKSLREGKRLLIEVTQACNLANNVESAHRNGTSADTTVAGALAAANIDVTRYSTKAINILKAPGGSRVGRGNIPSSITDQNRFSSEKITSLDQLAGVCTNFEAIISRYFNAIQPNGILEPVLYEDATGKYEIGEALAISGSRYWNEKGATTGKPRILRLYDAVLGKELADVQGQEAVLSCMDRGNDCEKWGIVVGYVVHLPSNKTFLEDKVGKFIDCNGHKYREKEIIRIGDAVPTDTVLQYCLPITKVVNGWKGVNLNKLQPGDQLPAAVSNFISEIEHYSNLEIRAIGTGPESKDTLFLKKM